jgi:hypothetical protein
MSVRLSELIGVMISVVILFTGCEKSYMAEEDEVSSGLDPNTISIPSGYTADIIEVAGGLDTWIGTKKMAFDCVVTIYEPDGSFYLTEQHYDVEPWSNAIEISGHEHENEYVWRFSNGTMSVIQGMGQDRKLFSDLEDSCFAQAVLAITTAPVRLLDSSAQFDKHDNAVKIQGQWYYPIDKTGGRSNDAVFYQNRDSLLVTMIRFTCPGADKSFAVRGYDYQKIEKDGALVPSKIEIFTTTAGDVLQKRLVKIDCHTMFPSK